MAPVDLRYDRNRGVWTAPPPYRLLYSTLLGCLSSGGTAKSQIDTTKTGSPIYDDDGSTISSQSFLTVTEKLGTCYGSGENIISYYDPVTCQNVVVEGEGLKLYNLVCVDGNTPSAFGNVTQ